jgi:hypothetical protein
MKLALLAATLFLASLHSFAAANLRCTANEAGLGFNYVTRIKWVNEESANVSFALEGEGKELPVCENATPLQVVAKGNLLVITGHLACEGGKADQVVTLTFDRQTMTLRDELRQYKCADAN